MKYNVRTILFVLGIILAACSPAQRNPNVVVDMAASQSQPTSCPEIPEAQYHARGEGVLVTDITCDRETGTTIQLASDEKIWLLLTVEPEKVTWQEPILQAGTNIRLECSLGLNDQSSALFPDIDNAGSLNASGFTTVSVSCTQPGSDLLVNVVWTLP